MRTFSEPFYAVQDLRHRFNGEDITTEIRVWIHSPLLLKVALVKTVGDTHDLLFELEFDDILSAYRAKRLIKEISVIEDRLVPYINVCAIAFGEFHSPAIETAKKALAPQLGEVKLTCLMRCKPPTDRLISIIERMTSANGPVGLERIQSEIHSANIPWDNRLTAFDLIAPFVPQLREQVEVAA